MNFTALFIRRPVMTTLLMAGIIVFGLVSYQRLPVSDLPVVEQPSINVFASLPGASPETMAATVATPLEKAFTAIPGIDEMTSNSTLGSTNVSLQFSPDRDIDAAAQDVNAAISQTLPFLPPNILTPSYRKQNPSAAPIMIITLTSPSLSLTALDEFAETDIAQRLTMIDGVAQVNVWGSAKYAVRVQLDPAALASRGIGVSQVANAVRLNNVMIPTGILYGPRRTVTIQATGQLYDADQFRQLIVAWRNGAPVRLGDLGLVLDDIQNNKVASWYNGERSISMAVQRQPGTNTLEVANRVKAMLAELERGLPAGVEVHLQYDRTVSIKNSVRDVKFSLVMALSLVVLVIFLFLRSAVATMIPSLTLPLAIIGTFSLMAILNFSIDNISLMALTLAVGFVVDDAIVMLENIVRHLEMGKPPRVAAIDGSSEVGFTILSMTSSLAVVFLPLAFMGGTIGRLFREFAITIAAAIVVSGIVSLTLTPMLCSRLLKAPDAVPHGRLYRMSQRVLDAARRQYGVSLLWVMRHRPIVVAVSVAVLVATAGLFTIVPKGLFPSDDTGLLNGTTEAAQGTSFPEMLRLQQIAAARLATDTNIASFTSSVGGWGGSSNQGNFSITLKPQGTRPSADQMVQLLTRRLSGIPGLTVYMSNPPSIRIGGRSSKSQYQYTLRGSDITQLYAEATRFMGRLREIPLLTAVTSDLLNTNPLLIVHIDRARAASLGTTPLGIEQALANAFNQQQVSTIYTPTNNYWVVMETVPSAQKDAAALERFYVPALGGRLVPLSDVATFEHRTGPLSVAHSGQMASVTISFNLAPDVALGAAVDAVNNAARRCLPATVSGAFAGAAQAFQASQQGMGLLLLITLFIIYLILGILYESFIHPVTILTGLPFAAFGALLALWLTGQELGVYGYVGIVMLIGIVMKNAIIMIDFALAAERNDGMTPAASIVHAAQVRFRPIMMTTVSAIASTLPIAIGVGASAASRRPLGIVVVGGLAISQIVTLYVTPVFYSYFDELRHWFGARFVRRGRATPALAVAGIASGRE